MSRIGEKCAAAKNSTLAQKPQVWRITPRNSVSSPKAELKAKKRRWPWVIGPSMSEDQRLRRLAVAMRS